MDETKPRKADSTYSLNRPKSTEDVGEGKEKAAERMLGRGLS